MKLNFLKLKRNKQLSPKSLRSPLFNIDYFWFVCLGVVSILLLMMALIGYNFFHYQYFENYKKPTSFESSDLINIERLNSTIERRNNFINKEISLPPDPSF